MTKFPDSFAAWQHLRARLGDAPRPVDTYGLADLAAQLVAVVESAKFPDKPIAAVLAEVTDDDVRAALTQLPHLHARAQRLEFDLRAVAQARGITDEPADGYSSSTATRTSATSPPPASGSTSAASR